VNQFLFPAIDNFVANFVDKARDKGPAPRGLGDRTCCGPDRDGLATMGGSPFWSQRS